MGIISNMIDKMLAKASTKEIEAMTKEIEAMRKRALEQVKYANSISSSSISTGPPHLVPSTWGQTVTETFPQQSWGQTHANGFTGNLHMHANSPGEKLHIVAMNRVQEYLLRNGIDFRVPVRTNVMYDQTNMCYHFQIMTMTREPLTTGVAIPKTLVENDDWDTVDFINAINTLCAGMVLNWQKYGAKDGNS